MEFAESLLVFILLALISLDRNGVDKEYEITQLRSDTSCILQNNHKVESVPQKPYTKYYKLNEGRVLYRAV